jgi:hypothetical protein
VSTPAVALASALWSPFNTQPALGIVGLKATNRAVAIWSQSKQKNLPRSLGIHVLGSPHGGIIDINAVAGSTKASAKQPGYKFVAEVGGVLTLAHRCAKFHCFLPNPTINIHIIRRNAYRRGGGGAGGQGQGHSVTSSWSKTERRRF